MTTEQILAIAAAILSLALEYIPGLAGLYDGLDPVRKRLVMLGLLTLVVAGALGGSCLGLLSVFTCDIAGLADAVYALVLAIVANQSVHRITKRS